MTTGRESNLEAARAFAAFGLAERAAGRRESASGPGSSVAAAQPTLELLRRTIARHRIGTILDLGCGDWNWMRLLGLPEAGQDRPIRYTGWEANADLVAELASRYERPGLIDFALRDITTAQLPKVDLIIARDVLFHLPLETAAGLVARIRQSCRFFLSTSFLGVTANADIASYLPIEGWGFHKVNLNIPPFGLAEQMEEALREPGCSNTGSSRYICLYRCDGVRK